eukprot:scaffold5383_cov152-Skeletonema_dohrnii-CCMP3373.AAC.8
MVPSLPLHRTTAVDNDAAAYLSEEKHPIEAADSWAAHIISSRPNNPKNDAAADNHADDTPSTRRQLRHSHHHNNNDDDFDATSFEEIKYQEDLKTKAQQQHHADKKLRKAAKKRQRRYQELFTTNSGIGSQSVHGLMIDAGSTGSRMHVYEFEPRVLMNKHEVTQAVSGKKLSFPGTNSRWTERLRPGISEFANIDDDEEMERAIADYLEPLLSFARSVMHSKEEEFGNFPIFLKATAGLRIVPSKQRQRVISTVRKLFKNETFCPFWDESERVRVISGEEEAVYDWAGVNVLLGNLMSNSEGVGEAYGGAIRTYGALDMGGASSQISYYQPEGDVMSGLFKLQIGQGKHWNVYAHSHLMYGMNEAEKRRKAHLVADTTAKARLQDGVFDPCLPGGGKKTIEFKSLIHIGNNGLETWNATVDDFASASSSTDPGLYHAVLVNNEETGNWDQCKELAKGLFNKEANAWCDYSHRGSCSFAGVYQPERPSPELEFYAFSNYFHVWQFLQLESRSSIAQLEAKGREVCSQSWDDLVQYNEGNQQNVFTEEELKTYCFRAAYVHEILRSGYGFKSDEYVIATDIVNGQKVTWALGSILYEINTLPWDYIEIHGKRHVNNHVQNDIIAEWGHQFSMFLTGVIIASILGVMLVFRRHRRRSKRKDGYEYLREASNNVEIEKLPLRSCPNFQVK